MTDELKAQLQAIGQECDDLMDEVDNALDEHATFHQQLTTRTRVDDVTRRFRELVAPLGEDDKMAIDRTVGRKVRDLQKMAGRLPAPPAGAAAPAAQDDAFLGTRATAASSSRQPRVLGSTGGEPRRGEEPPRFRVTGEVEAWCGPCGQLRTHTIIAIVDGLPAQVVCGVCGGRHKFRQGPARKKGGEEAPRARVSHTPTAAEREHQRKMEERNALLNELRNAANVRPFSPHERYKAGEIIEHPEHGRGKIENTLPRSLLVRFSSGLRQVKLS